MPFFPPSTSSTLGWINVLDYGAIGNGTTDDTAAITAAIAALPSSGGVLYFPTGTYLTSGGFVIGVPCIVRGDGGFLDYRLYAQASTVQCTSPTAVLFEVTATYACFEHIALVNTAATTPSAGSGIQVSAAATLSQKVDYSNITLANFYIGLDSRAGVGWVMTDSLVSNPVLYGVKIQNMATPDAGDWVLQNVSFFAGTHSGTAAVELWGSGGGRIANCKVVNGDTLGAAFGRAVEVLPQVGVSTSDLLITNCSFENLNTTSGIGINVDLVAGGGAWGNILIHGTQIFSVKTGIRIAASVGFDLHGLLSGLVFTAVTGAQIRLEGVNDLIVDNVISDATGPTVSMSNCTNVLDRSHSLRGLPSAAAGAQNGTSPPAPTLSGSALDQRGVVSFGSGASPASGAQAVLTWGNEWSAAPIVMLTPLNAATAALGLFVSAVGASSGFTIGAANPPSASQSGATYAVQYTATA